MIKKTHKSPSIREIKYDLYKMAQKK